MPVIPPLLLAACAGGPAAEPDWAPTRDARTVEVLPSFTVAPPGVELRTVHGLARIEGTWHVALAEEAEWTENPLPTLLSSTSPAIVPPPTTRIGLYPVTGGDPTYTFTVPTGEAVLVATDSGLPWLMYNEGGAAVRAWRVGQDGSAWNGGVPGRASLGHSGWSDAAPERGPPEGVLAWATSGAEHRRTWWMAAVGGQEAGRPVEIGTFEREARIDLDVFRSRAGIAALTQETSPDGKRTLAAVVDGSRRRLPVDATHGYRGLYTHDGRMIVAEGRAAEEPEGLVVHDSRYGRRVLPVDGAVEGDDLALVECGGTAWLVIYSLHSHEPRGGLRVLDGIYQDARVPVFDLDAASDPVEIPTSAWLWHRAAPIARCGGDEAAVAFVADDMRDIRVVVSGWRW